MKPFHHFFTLISLVLLSSCQPAIPPQDIEFTILQLNDVYEIAPVEGGKYGGLARVATLKNQLINEGNHVITVLAGDFLSPSLIGTLKYNEEKIRGKQMVDALNALGLDVVTFGNHEFDDTEESLLKRINESNFIWTSCNTFHKQGDLISPFQQNGKPVPNYVLLKVGNAIDTIQISIIGTTLPFNKRSFVHYEDDQTSVVQTLNNIRDHAQINFILSHLSIEQDKILAEKIQDVPLIMGGHDHHNMLVNVNKNYITKADANAKSVYIHRVKYNVSQKKYTIDSELKLITDEIEQNEEVAKVVSKWTEISNKSMKDMGYSPNKVVIKTTDTLDGRENSIRFEPTNLGRYTAMAMLKSDSAIDFAAINSGSIRLDDQLTGTITQYDVLRTFPFGGGVAITTMKGDDLIQLLNIGLTTNIGTGGYLQTTPVSLKEGNWFLNDSTQIKISTSYRIMISDFLSTGGEANLEFLKSFSYIFPLDLYGNIPTKNDIRDVFIRYSSEYFQIPK